MVGGGGGGGGGVNVKGGWGGGGSLRFGGGRLGEFWGRGYLCTSVVDYIQYQWLSVHEVKVSGSDTDYVWG